MDTDGNYNGMELCFDFFGFDPKPLPPYGPENANMDMSTLGEEGFKEVQGYLTEGRWLVFEQDGLAIANNGAGAKDIVLTEATSGHESKKQRWVIHDQGGAPIDGGKGSSGTYILSSAEDSRYLASHTSLSTSVNGAQTYNITYLGNGQGYSLQKENGKYLNVKDGEIYISSQATGWKAYSVSYHS